MLWEISSGLLDAVLPDDEIISWKNLNNLQPLIVHLAKALFSTARITRALISFNHINFKHTSSKYDIANLSRIRISTSCHNRHNLRFLHCMTFQTIKKHLFSESLSLEIWPHQSLYDVNYLTLTKRKSLHGAEVRFRKFKSCQNHLQLHLWLPNYVVLTVRTEKPPKNLFNQLRQGGIQNGHFIM